MTREIGFAFVFNEESGPEPLENMLSAGCRAIELMPRVSSYESELPSSLIKLVKLFSYRSIHLPKGKSGGNQKNAYFVRLARQISAQTITAHPESAVFGIDVAAGTSATLGIENMDNQKALGRSTDDMKEIFQQWPQCGWVFDVNHVLTNDPSLELGVNLMQNYRDRLRHYHISGYGSAEIPHQPLFESNQPELFKLVTTNHPIIIESFGFDLTEFRREFRYVLNNLDQN
jgi:hypothetical protein